MLLLRPNLVVGSVCLTVIRAVVIHWQVDHGHIWWANLNNVKPRGSWCRSCAGLLPLRWQTRARLLRTAGESFCSRYTRTFGHGCTGGAMEEPSEACNTRRRTSWCPICAQGRRRLTLSRGAEVGHSPGRSVPLGVLQEHQLSVVMGLKSRIRAPGVHETFQSAT